MNQSRYARFTLNIPFLIQHFLRKFTLVVAALLLFSTAILAEAATASQPYKTKTADGTHISSDVPFSALERKLLSAPKVTGTVPTIQPFGMQNLVATANPTPCKLMVFQAPIRCILQTTGNYGIGGGASAADIAAVIPGCTQVAVGTTFAANTPAAGVSACYQFVVTNTATVASQVLLPADVGGIAELYIEFPNTLGGKATDAQSPSSPLNLNVTTAYRRVVLMIRPASGIGGQTMSIGIGVPAVPIPGQLNDDPSRAKVLKMNDTVSGTIQASGQNRFYYFYPTTNRQTSAQLYANFASNQVAGYRLAQRSAAGVFSWNEEVPLTSLLETDPQTITGLTPTPTGSTTINGIMIRVENQTAAIGNFKVRAGVKTAYIFSQGTWNNENLTRIYDVARGLRQAHSYIGVWVELKDADGLPVAGEQVQYDLYQDASGTGRVSSTAVSDQSGRINFVSQLPYCFGVNRNVLNIDYSIPADRWSMNGQKAKFNVRLPNSVPPPPEENDIDMEFYNVCSETYLGRG